ncbi:MAG: hypothetical protein IJU98_02810 [Synergistaceae bacterium]|nr:hypothetical protein [Synergistaceae bacterium]
MEKYESIFSLLPVQSTYDAEELFEQWGENVQQHCGVYEDEEAEDEADSQTARTAAADDPLIVYDTTEIKSELSGIPYNTDYDLGKGYNALTNLEASMKTAFSNNSSALKSLMPTSGGTPETKFTYKFVSTASEMEKEMGTQASLSLAGNALGLTNSSTTNHKFGITSTTLLIRYSELETEYRQLPTDGLVLTADAQNALKEGSDAFREDFGDYYVSGYQYGGSYMASLTVTTRTTEQLDKMTTGINANLQGSDGESIVSGSFSRNMKDLMKNNNATVTFQSVTHGMGKDPLTKDIPVVSAITSGDVAIEDLVKGLREFKADMASKFSAETYSPVFVKLSRFRNLPGMRSKIDKDIPVPSDHATNIMAFNRKVMNMRGYYNVITQKETDAIINPSVVQGYEDRFNRVIDTVTVNKNRFYTNRRFIPVLLPEVKALCKEMKALGDRYTFYRMLMQAQEDQVNTYGAIKAKVGEGMEYGYSNFLSSEAVTEDIEAGSSRGKIKEVDFEEPNPLKNPAPADWYGDNLDAGENNIFCYFKFTTDNKDGDNSREIESPSVGKRKVQYDLKSGISRSYGYHFRLMPMRFNKTDYPMSGLKYQ